jgi:ADP-ribose pyrophosphatase YjhB (NUDIX family)
MVNKPRHTRYQGAIIQNGHILLIEHHFHADGGRYWVIPGGGIEPDETEEACVVREMREETHLEVRVERLLLHEAAHAEDATYHFYKTYLCHPLSGEAKPGYEPEPDAASAYAIAQVKWFNLQDETDWDAALKADPITYPLLKRISFALHRPDGP